jgi:FimV-like protein
MLVALFKSNAGAFEGNNMNRLRSGAIITVPSAEEAAATAAPEADARRARAGVRLARLPRPHRRGRPVGRRRAGSRGRGTHRRRGDEATPAARAGGDQVRIGLGRDGTGHAARRTEDALARDQQLREAQTRIAMLEKTIADLQKAVQMRSAPMAQAQQQAEVATGKAPPAPADDDADDPRAKDRADPKPEPAEGRDRRRPSREGRAAEGEHAAAERQGRAGQGRAAEDRCDAERAAEGRRATTAEPPKAATKAAPKVAEPPKGRAGLLRGPVRHHADVGDRRRRAGDPGRHRPRSSRCDARKTTKFEDSIISGTDIKTNTVFGSTGGGVVNTGDNSLASDFSREGLGNIDTDEVDPIAEAEVYLAYGRDAQAEEILKDALKKDPQRQEIYLKLLEIHAQHNKPSAFETGRVRALRGVAGPGRGVAQGRRARPPARPGQPDVRRRRRARDARRAGRERHVRGVERLQAGHVEGRQGLRHGPRRGDLAVADVGRDREADGEIVRRRDRDPPPRQPRTRRARRSGRGRRRRRHGRRRRARSHESRVERRANPWPRRSRPRRQVRHGVPPRRDRQAAPMRRPSPRSRRPAPAPRAVRPTARAPGRGARARQARPVVRPDKATYEDPTPSVLDGQWHDAATKLDLAKAYQEMGDVEGAREILQEVLHEGDDEQKKEAKAILGKLG